MRHTLSEWEYHNLVTLRVLEGSREIGVLLMTFSLLDGALSDQPLSAIWVVVLALFTLGLAVFLYGVVGERRLHASR